jgi:hypothetical protein
MKTACFRNDGGREKIPYYLCVLLVCIAICVCMHIFTCVCQRDMYVCILCVFMYVCTYARMYACMCVFMYACMYQYTYARRMSTKGGEGERALVRRTPRHASDARSSHLLRLPVRVCLCIRACVRLSVFYFSFVCANHRDDSIWN